MTDYRPKMGETFLWNRGGDDRPKWQVRMRVIGINNNGIQVEIVSSGQNSINSYPPGAKHLNFVRAHFEYAPLTNFLPEIPE